MNFFNDKRISNVKKWAFTIPEHSIEPLDRSLKKLMGATGYSEGGLAKRIGISTTSIYHYLHALRKPKDSVMERLARAFDIKPSYFLEYRLNELCDYLNRNPKLLDIFLDIASEPDMVIEEWEKEEKKRQGNH